MTARDFTIRIKLGGHRPPLQSNGRSYEPEKARGWTIGAGCTCGRGQRSHDFRPTARSRSLARTTAHPLARKDREAEARDSAEVRPRPAWTTRSTGGAGRAYGRRATGDGDGRDHGARAEVLRNVDGAEAGDDLKHFGYVTNEYLRLREPQTGSLTKRAS